MFIRRLITQKNEGLYTVEGALTIVIFTALIMMLLSIIMIIETEVEVQSAINQTALQLSQYSYAVGNEVDITTSEETTLKGIIQNAKREAVGFTMGSALCEMLIRDRVDEKAVSQIDGGFFGIDFSFSNILGDGKTITIIAIYKINVNTFGLVDKTLNICQKAQTVAWLPYYADTLASPDLAQGGNCSIWNETNFARGQYFVSEEKEKSRECSVEPGQGIDLYYKSSGKVVEVYSLNVFDSSYSYNDGDLSKASDYSPNEESIKKQINRYVKEYKKDISDCGSSITMESGAEEKFSPKEKELIIIVPSEAKGQEAFESVFDNLKSEIKSKSGIDLKIVFSEDAL